MWNYGSSSWEQCPNTYCGQSSTSTPPSESAAAVDNSYWYSSTLRSDGSSTGTSYDSTYRASYSYDGVQSDVHKWNYGTSTWEKCQYTYCGETSLLAKASHELNLKAETLAQKTEFQYEVPSSSSGKSAMVTGLVLASLSIVSVVAYKVKNGKENSELEDSFLRN